VGLLGTWIWVIIRPGARHTQTPPIVSIILFWPLGIAAIINATKVDPAWQMGNAAMAREHSNKAKMFSMIATIIGAVGFVIYFIIGWRFGLSLFGSE